MEQDMEQNIKWSMMKQNLVSKCTVAVQFGAMIHVVPPLVATNENEFNSNSKLAQKKVKDHKNTSRKSQITQHQSRFIHCEFSETWVRERLQIQRIAVLQSSYGFKIVPSSNPK